MAIKYTVKLHWGLTLGASYDPKAKAGVILLGPLVLIFEYEKE